ncbi:MAG: AhpC/TSA family protein [Balneolaceae bacterium]|nr:MAG: AhpC/TSA family protein [Balneolaceae bacterium]
MKNLLLLMTISFLPVAVFASHGMPAAGGNGLPGEAAAVQPLLIGADAPDVTLRTVSGESVALRDMHPGTPLMVIFYRGGWCPFCNRHLAELAAMEQDIRDLGMEIVAISPDSPGQLAEGLGDHEPAYTLLSDTDRSAARHFGIAFEVTDSGRVSALVERTGHTTTPEENYIFPVPAVFILDTDGVIRFQYVDPDYSRRISGAILMAAAEYVAGL